MFPCEINNLLQHLFRIKCSGRVVRIDDYKSFGTVCDLTAHIFDVRIPVRLFIADIMNGFATGKCGTGGPQRIVW